MCPASSADMITYRTRYIKVFLDKSTNLVYNTHDTQHTHDTHRGITMSKIIAFCNQKGGVGKTTTATTMAAALQLRGYKVLLIDGDPQGNATDTYRAAVKETATLYDFLFEGEPANECIQKTNHGLIIAADPLLKEASKHLDGVSGAYRLRERLSAIRDDFDFILIDTPPTIGELLTNALTASDEVIIPVTADRYGVQGLAQLQETIADIRKYTNKSLTVAGMLMVKYTWRTRLSREIHKQLKEIAEMFGTIVFKSTIRESTKAREAQTMQMSLFEYAPKSTTAVDYEAFVEEYLKG